MISGAEGWKMEEDELTDLTTIYNTTTDGSNFFDLRNIKPGHLLRFNLQVI